jgi:hypothetical protein
VDTDRLGVGLKLTTVLLAIAVAFAVAVSAASAAPGVEMRVSKFAILPDRVLSGGSFKVSGSVGNSGRKRHHARLEVSLRGGDEIGSKRIDAVPAGGKRKFDVRATLPADLPAGEYVIEACVPEKGTAGRPRCRSEGGLVVIGP